MFEVLSSLFEFIKICPNCLTIYISTCNQKFWKYCQKVERPFISYCEEFRVFSMLLKCHLLSLEEDCRRVFEPKNTFTSGCVVLKGICKTASPKPKIDIVLTTKLKHPDGLASRIFSSHLSHLSGADSTENLKRVLSYILGQFGGAGRNFL